MKCKVYMRVAKSSGPKGYKVAASIRPNYQALTLGSGYSERAVPTAAFALELDIPEAIFKRAEQVLAELELDEGDVQVAALAGAR